MEVSTRTVTVYASFFIISAALMQFLPSDCLEGVQSTVFQSMPCEQLCHPQHDCLGVIPSLDQGLGASPHTTHCNTTNIPHYPNTAMTQYKHLKWDNWPVLLLWKCLFHRVLEIARDQLPLVLVRSTVVCSDWLSSQIILCRCVCRCINFN